MNNSLQLLNKIGRINCEQHHSPIVSLNITPCEERAKRLCCQCCQTCGKNIIFPKIAEDYLVSINQIQENQYQSCITLMKEIEKAEERIMKLFKEFKQHLSYLTQEFKDEINNNELQILINKFFNKQILGASDFQELAEIISKQQVENGELKYTSLLNQSKIYPQIENTISQLVKNLKNVIDNTDILKQNIDNCINKTHLQYRNPILLDGHSNKITAIAISCDYKLIASATSHGQIILWNLYSKKQKQEYLDESNYGISDLLFTSDLQYLAAAQFEHQQSCDILLFKLNQILFTPSITLKGHTRSICRIRLTQNSQHLLSISADRTLKIWNIQQEHCIYTEQFPDSVKLNGLAISQDQQYISCVCENGYTILFDSINLTNLRLLTQWKAHDYAYGATFTPDSEQLITCSKEIKVWSIRQLTGYYQKSPIRTFNCDNYTWNVSFALNGTNLITYDEKIKIWEFKTGKLIKSLEVPGGYSKLSNKQFVLTSDMSYIITGDKNEQLKIYQKIV